MSKTYERYYVPAQSPWPIVGAIALFCIAFGAGHLVIDMSKQQSGFGGWLLLAGFAILVFMLVGWFRNIIEESMSGLYSSQMDRSFRQGMSWFIVSEVMFFMAFFGALFYGRVIAMEWLGGASNNAMTFAILWPDFEPVWPLVKTPGGIETQAMPAWGLPAINTAILLISSVTLHFAHTGLEQNKRGQLKGMLFLTLVLGVIFLCLQGYEYVHAYRDLGLRLDSGFYGNTFYLLTGFHGLHVTLGALILFFVFLRVLKGHFTPEKHFAFQAGAWYWHFVDVVWLCLFVFVYVL
ncbi:MAG: cytochrome c oxidase subunit 3 [Alishewanella agri]|jgi:cytochrome c oxidase subunit 3|uniref:cytochrome-c oxidase n=1 Tax=Alishewanella agri BL06 TaxID=1195246 RepID=I9P099_9ALTE|nr:MULTISPECIES: cytochrome c oxidase subunit 3 [Alishewanella]MDD4863673.1 cytochrome c oxidase subunit 3 [Alishewanella agri]OYW96795.1 MAG: cytochrome c oxidase subunit 3 [Alishewanella sp. 32-51-5]OZB43346.1 MAG: cytochrome c oxidase subunit 3 [Alishewanella sp. 34-51-39]EIW88307.1 Cytochrome c oxidase subunit III [Alishewanella agri BL06]KRS20175.1 MFS transporter [Alishewanella sp. WH16-1]